VPKEFTRLDPRWIIKTSTKVRVADDLLGKRAKNVASDLNDALEKHWRDLEAGDSHKAAIDYEAAKHAAYGC
jgi:hypothetical protein